MKITNAADITNEHVTYLIYSNPGVGKTRALEHLPGKTLVVDIDHSSSVLKGNKNIDILKVDSHDIWKDWISIVSELVNNKEKYEKEYTNIAIDNVSELFRSTLANLGREGKNNRVPTMGDYQRVDFTILDSLRALKQLDLRLVITAWETSDKWETESGQTFNRAMPDIRPKIMNNFLGLVDVVGRLTVNKDNDGNVKRGFVLQPSDSVYAKNRLDERKGCLVDQLVPTSDSEEDE